MATHLKIFVLTCLVLLTVVMEEVKPVFAKQKERLKQKTKVLEQSMTKLKERVKELEECKACSKIKELNKTLSKLQEKVDFKPAVTMDCAELYKSGKQNSGVYTINPDGSGAFDVSCDQTTDGGGWTVFQKRLDASVDFFRGWTDYKQGFGNLNGEFWLGLEKIHHLTNSGQYKLRVELEDYKGNTAYAEYDTFAVANEENKYQLSVGGYSGTAGDMLTYHNGYPFSTKDHDNTNWPGCAASYKGAWWFRTCSYQSDLNAVGPTWNVFPGALKGTEMKIRPVDFLEN